MAAGTVQPAAADIAVVNLMLLHEGMGLGNVVDKARIVMVVSNDGTGRGQSSHDTLDHRVKAWA